MTHVFIVNEQTLKCHLEYMFAGTGAKDDNADFLYDEKSTIHHATERNLVGMIADISRVKIGDKVIFYLEATSNSEGRFYGVFEVASNPFFDPNDEGNYLYDELGKKLSFRVIIKATDFVYPLGVTEHELLDSLDKISAPHEMCWSLIYRKLKGNRGCTMITDFESNMFFNKLKNKNTTPLISNGYSYNEMSNSIIAKNNTNIYTGRKQSLDIKNRLIHKFIKGKAFEVHLQAYLLQNINSKNLKPLLLSLPNENDYWIGNEVSCGVGMQRIDMLAIEENNDTVYIAVIELKCGEAYDDIINRQLPWYIEWLNDYIVPTFSKKVEITPIVLTAETADIKASAVINFTKLKANAKLNSVKNIFFKINGKEIDFYKL